MQPVRLTHTVPAVTLGGSTLTDVTLTGTRYGPADAATAFVLFGGITATDTPFGVDAGDAGWWWALAGPDRIDPSRHAVYCPALPGKGTTWPALADRSAELPDLSPSDLADLVEAWLDAAGCPDGVRLIGASLGGMVALSLAARHPQRASRLVVVSAGARPDGWGTGLRHLQREVVRQALAADAPADGMRLARQLGMLTYRGRDEIEARFAPDVDGLTPPIASYLDHHGDKFAQSFDPRAFLLLSSAIDRHPLGADTDAIRRALAPITARTVVVGVPQDLLFPFKLQKALHADLRAAGVDSMLRTLTSDYGHDAFLADQAALASVLDDAAVFAPDPEPQPQPQPGVAHPTVRTIRLGLVGGGTVGQALLALLHARRDDLAERHGLAFEVVGMAVRDPLKDRGPHAQGLPRTTDPMALVADPMVDVVVEVAGGVAAMDPVVRAALAAGKPVVTANKALVAQELGDLAALSRLHGTPLACEAAAAAALPVVRSLARQVDGVTRVLGVVNGTSNYVLTRLAEGMAMEDAVAKAQALGFAEADPSADLDGHDAAAKLTILVYRAFGAWVRPDAFGVRGIRTLTPLDLELAELLGHRVRHVAWAEHDHGTLRLGVEPLALPSWHLLAGVEEEYNAVYLEGEAAGDLAFFGRGAGGGPTASAVIADLVDLAHGTAPHWPVPQALALSPASAHLRRHLLRMDGTADALDRVGAVLRRAGLEVRRDTVLRAGARAHAAWLLDPAIPTDVDAAAEALRLRPGVERVRVLGVTR